MGSGLFLNALRTNQDCSATVSFHLKKLEDAGAVKSYKRP